MLKNDTSEFSCCHTLLILYLTTLSQLLMHNSDIVQLILYYTNNIL
jgi:hypothetical protein